MSQDATLPVANVDPTQGRIPFRWGWAAAAIIVATLLAYAPIRDQDYTNYDDPDYITGNEHVQAGLSLDGIRWACTTSHASNWHPLTWMSLQADATLFGVDRPLGVLAVNLGMHLASTTLLILAVGSATGRWPAALLVGMLFALHPVQVESVAWASQRKSVLAMMLGMAAVAAYLRYRRAEGIRWYVGAIGLAALSLLAKPMFVVMPILLLLVDLGLKQQSSTSVPTFRARLVDKIPFVVLSLISVATTLWAQEGALAESKRLPMTLRLATAIVAVGEYLTKLVNPTHLAVFYPHPLVMPTSVELIVWLAILLGTTLLVILLWRFMPLLAVGWFWFLVALLPTIGIVQVGGQFVADRYLYLPIVGIGLAVISVLDRVLQRMANRDRILIAIAMVLAIPLGILTHRQVATWRDSVTLFEHALAVTRGNYIAHYHLAVALADRDDLKGAQRHWQRAYDLGYRDPRLVRSLAAARARTGEIDRAILLLEDSLARASDDSATRVTLAEVLISAGRMNEAGEQLRLVRAIDPDHPRARELLEQFFPP